MLQKLEKLSNTENEVWKAKWMLSLLSLSPLFFLFTPTRLCPIKVGYFFYRWYRPWKVSAHPLPRCALWLTSRLECWMWSLHKGTFASTLYLVNILTNFSVKLTWSAYDVAVLSKYQLLTSFSHRLRSIKFQQTILLSSILVILQPFSRSLK